MRARLFTLAAASGLLVGAISGLSPASAQSRLVPIKAIHSQSSQAIPSMPAVPAGILYNQNDNNASVGIVSQNFGDPGFDIYDAQAADDFAVPAGQTWTITSVFVTGVYFNGVGPSPSVNVTFYQDSGGLPGAQVSTETLTPGVPRGPSGGIRLHNGVTLSSGTYWLSVQAVMDFATGGEWAWETRAVQSNSASAWQNPGDGFLTGCTTWQNMQNCIGPLGEGPDFMFALIGVSS
jgi:hypothetical protein